MFLPDIVTSDELLSIDDSGTSDSLTPASVVERPNRSRSYRTELEHRVRYRESERKRERERERGRERGPGMRRRCHTTIDIPCDPIRYLPTYHSLR